MEGFFVARMAGEAEARRHHLTEERGPIAESPDASAYDERLGELPNCYEDDAAILLPRDPQTLFFFWDFQTRTRELALEGLPQPRAKLRVFEGSRVVRELDFALESRSFYIHDLVPGRTYRVEAHFVGADGRSRRVGPSSNLVALPGSGPSSDTNVRFLRIPWDLPLQQLLQYLKDGRARIDELGAHGDYLAVERWALPTSASHPPGSRPSSRAWTPPPSGRPY